MTKNKSFKHQIAQELLTQVRKSIPDAKAGDLWKVSLVAAAVGYILTQLELLGSGIHFYGWIMFACGLVMSLITFTKDAD